MPWFTDVTNNTPNKFWIEEYDLVWARVHPSYKELTGDELKSQAKSKKPKKEVDSDSNATD